MVSLKLFHIHRVNYFTCDFGSGRGRAAQHVFPVKLCRSKVILSSTFNLAAKIEHALFDAGVEKEKIWVAQLRCFIKPD